MYIYDISQFSLELEMLETNMLQKFKTHFMFNNLFSENLAPYGEMWKNNAVQDRPQMII